MKAVINKENIEVMKTLHDAGVELAKIAKIVNVSYTVVTRAKRAGFNFETYKQDIHDRNQKYSKLNVIDKKFEPQIDEVLDEVECKMYLETPNNEKSDVVKLWG